MPIPTFLVLSASVGPLYTREVESLKNGGFSSARRGFLSAESTLHLSFRLESFKIMLGLETLDLSLPMDRRLVYGNYLGQVQQQPTPSKRIVQSFQLSAIPLNQGLQPQFKGQQSLKYNFFGHTLIPLQFQLSSMLICHGKVTFMDLM